MKVKIKKLNIHAQIPQYQTAGAAGFDLTSLCSHLLEPGETKLISTGLAIEIPSGWEMQVRPRSGLSLKTALRVANAPGTIDSDFRGEICIIIANTSATCREFIDAGARIAQGVITPAPQVEFDLVDELTPSERGSSGYGSTGK